MLLAGCRSLSKESQNTGISLTSWKVQMTWQGNSITAADESPVVLSKIF